MPGMSPRHESLEDLFRSVLPPRPVPLRKRLMWRALLALVAFPPSRALLLRLRRH
jgi:hypothetical protein